MSSLKNLTLGLSIATIVGLSMNMGYAVAAQPGTLPPTGGRTGGGAPGPTTGGGAGAAGGSPQLPGLGGGQGSGVSSDKTIGFIPKADPSFGDSMWTKHLGQPKNAESTTLLAGLKGGIMADGTEIPADEAMIAAFESAGHEVKRKWRVFAVANDKGIEVATFVESSRTRVETSTAAGGLPANSAIKSVEAFVVSGTSTSATGDILPIYGTISRLGFVDRSGFGLFLPMGTADDETKCDSAAAGMAAIVNANQNLAQFSLASDEGGITVIRVDPAPSAETMEDKCGHVFAKFHKDAEACDWAFRACVLSQIASLGASAAGCATFCGITGVGSSLIFTPAGGIGVGGVCFVKCMALAGVTVQAMHFSACYCMHRSCMATAEGEFKFNLGECMKE